MTLTGGGGGGKEGEEDEKKRMQRQRKGSVSGIKRMGNSEEEKKKSMSVDDFDHQHKPLIALVVVSCHSDTGTSKEYFSPTDEWKERKREERRP